MDNTLTISHLTVSYHSKPVLWDVNLSLPSGILVGIIGPNGAGKSTMIKAALDVIPRNTGEVSFWGHPYHKIRQKIGYVPQRETVDWEFPISVLDVVCMGRYHQIGWCLPVTKKHILASQHFLEEVGLEAYADRQISQLSGGQQQRVFIARALAQEADLYFMDEPFAGVDMSTERTIMGVLQKLRDQGKTVVCVHHDLSTVKEYFDYVICLNTHLVAAGPVADVFNEQTLKATYGGRLPLLEQAAQAMVQATHGE